MATRKELQDLALLRLQEAETLFGAGFYDGCVYLCGYVVELALKACICRLLDTDDYPATGEYKRVFAVHDLDQLLFLAGLRAKLDPADQTLSCELVPRGSVESNGEALSSGRVGRPTASTRYLERSKGLKGRSTRMAKEELVADFQAFARNLEESVGPVALLMLMPLDPGPEHAWALLVSTHAFDDQSQRDSIKTVVAHLNSSLSETVRPSVKRVSVLKSDDPFVRAMNSSVHAEHSSVDITARVVGGVEIPRAIVFESKRIAA